MGRMKSIISAPEKLNRNHIVEHFDCGNPELNICLQRFAFQNQKANAAITFVACLKKKIIAYYSLAVGSIEHQHATPQVKKGSCTSFNPSNDNCSSCCRYKISGSKNW